MVGNTGGRWRSGRGSLSKASHPQSPHRGLWLPSGCRTGSTVESSLEFPGFLGFTGAPGFAGFAGFRLSSFWLVHEGTSMKERAENESQRKAGALHLSPSTAIGDRLGQVVTGRSRQKEASQLSPKVQARRNTNSFSRPFLEPQKDAAIGGTIGRGRKIKRFLSAPRARNGPSRPWRSRRSLALLAMWCGLVWADVLYRTAGQRSPFSIRAFWRHRWRHGPPNS